MREILFRGKRTDNGEWVEGDVLQTRYYSGHIEYQIMPQTPVSSAYPVLSETVGQYTGLDVANGNVFDGDYLKFGAYILEVFWNGETFQWQAGKVGKSYDIPFRCCGNYRGDKWTVIDLGEIAAEPIITGRMTTEIVGNRWDNPELIPKTTQYEIEF